MKQCRVLIVEDDERILNFLRSKLKASGYEVSTANDGVQGLEQAQAPMMESRVWNKRRLRSLT